MSYPIEIYELAPSHQKSYYGKAKVIQTGNIVTLLSYDTNVCSYNKQTHEFTRLWNGYSATTMKHINDFLAVNKIQGGGKKWWCDTPVNVAVSAKLEKEI